MSEETTGNSERLNRRKLIKAVGVAGSTTAISGKVAAFSRKRPKSAKEAMIRKERAEEVREKYSSLTDVSDAVSQHASEFVKALVAEGYLNKPILTDVEKVLPAERFVRAREGVVVTVIPDGKDSFKADIIIAKEVDKGTLEVHIQPADGHTYATLEPDTDASESLILRGNSTSDGMTIEPEVTCSYGTVCLENYSCCGPCGCNVGTCHRYRDVKQCDDGTCEYGELGDCCADPTAPPC